ncbi:MAG: NPCBM/NEW2 domain-containing protein [Paludibacteraceae bacterium]|nr:NPCBM/NEW2 domain-containing protein [Paludibacteraceae bacterium]
MKKIFFLALTLLSAIGAQSKVYLVDVLQPTESQKIRVCSPKTDMTSMNAMEVSHLYRSNGGITLIGGAHGLVGSNEHGFAVYKLNKAYSKLSFFLAPTAYVGKPQDKSILTITADGKRVLDQPVFNYDAPRFITIDVKNVDELRFKVVVGEIDLSLAKIQLWKEGETVTQPQRFVNYPQGTLKLVEQLNPYFTEGDIQPIQDPKKKPRNGEEYPSIVPSIEISRHTFTNGLQFTSSEQLIGKKLAWSYFWLGKRYEKLSFTVGPRDNKSSNSSAWLVIYGDKKKILYEGIVTQTDIPRTEVIDVSGQEQIGFSCELRSNDFLGSITFGAVDICAHPKGDPNVPKPGLANINKDKISQLPSPCPLMSNILPYSVRGVAEASSTMFTGESSYVTFSMGGEKYYEGIILTAGNTLFDDKIDAYATFDLAEEFDYVSFYAGALTQHRVLDDDRMCVYADDELILDTVIHCTWPNVYFELPLHKCRSLRFAKPSSGKRKQTYIGIGDITLYRGEPVANDLFTHEKPDCPYEADLIDLCERPYFHFVGRYLSTLTNFDFNDCFKNGSTQREFFQMKDGSKIYKGVMLEANVPLGFEDISLSEAAFMFILGAGSSMSASNVSAATGISAGAGMAGSWAVTKLMNNQNGGQASVVAFNPYGEYETCTFTVANKSEYWDEMDKVFRKKGTPPDTPFTLNIFADQQLVGQVQVSNRMEPQTIIVPIHKCHQLMFWLEPGNTRSGQFVLYDIKVSKQKMQ